jgi:mannonate dehydratase
MKKIEQTWRWFGPKDPVSLQDVRQAGATGIVSALHQIPNGQPWGLPDILERKNIIEAAGLRWSVIESIAVHEDIKKRTGNYRQWIENYKTSLRNAGAAGIPTVCYNFMPVLDWTRTDLAYLVEDGSEALRFDMVKIAAFDIYMLKRLDATADYTANIVENAEKWYKNADEAAKYRLIRTIIAGLPGSEESYGIEDFRSTLAGYVGITAAQLQNHLVEFLREIAPVAEEAGIRLAIHPDDPPFPMFGLPRVVSTADDVERVYAAYDSPANGLCFCAGSFGARRDNNLSAMFEQLAPRVNFLHLRQVQLEPDGSFYEANHLEGSHDVYALMRAVVAQQQRCDSAIPMRPDHGHRMLDDLRKTGINPGYTAIGRLRGLAELRGLELGILRGMYG